MVARYTAGAMNLPFFPLRSYTDTDLPVANPLIRPIDSPYGDEPIYAVPPLKPDVTIVHAQRADAAGDTQVWGLLGCQKEAAFAAERRHRRRRGAGRRVGHPGRSEPHDHPRPDRRRGRRRAVRRASVVRPGLLRPRQRVLPRVGARSRARRSRCSVARRVGLRRRRPRRVHGEAGPSAAGRLASRRRRRPARSTTGSTDEPDRRRLVARPR